MQYPLQFREGTPLAAQVRTAAIDAQLDEMGEIEKAIGAERQCVSDIHQEVAESDDQDRKSILRTERRARERLINEYGKILDAKRR